MFIVAIKFKRLSHKQAQGADANMPLVKFSDPIKELAINPSSSQ